MQHVAFDPRSGFRDELIHGGVDIMLVAEDHVVLSVDGIGDAMNARPYVEGRPAGTSFELTA